MSEGTRGHDLHTQSDVMVHLEGEIMSDDEELITRERDDDDEAPDGQHTHIPIFFNIMCNLVL